MSPFKLPLNLFQFIREEKNKEDQGDQYERKQDEIEEVRIHPFTPGGQVEDYKISFSYYDNKVNPSTPQKCWGLPFGQSSGRGLRVDPAFR